MNLQIHQIPPLKLSILCGLLSALLNFLIVPYSQGTIFFLVFFLLNFFWLTPLMVVTLIHGKRYGLLASGFVAIIAIIFTAPETALITFMLSSLPAVYAADLVKQKKPGPQTSYIGLGRVFSRLCFFYLIIMALSLTVVFDQPIIEETAKKILTGVGHQDIAQLSHTFITLFPALIGCSNLILVSINLITSLKIMNRLSPSIRPYPLVYDAEMPNFWDIVFISSLLLILTQHEMSAFIGKNVLLLSCLPLYLYGLSIIGTWLKQFETWKSWVIFIVMISVFLAWPAVVVIVLGLLGPILKIKQD